MLVRKSTLSFVVFGAAVFVIGSSFLVYTRPEYTREYLPSTWRDWTGLGSGPNDRPLPIDTSTSSSPPPNTPKLPGASPDGSDIHILPVPSHDEDIGVRPLPPSTETQLKPIAVSSEPLAARLRALLSAPLPSYAESLKASEKTCPRDVADRQVNPDQLSGQLENWATTESEDLAKRRMAIVQYMETLEREKVPLVADTTSSGKGRGIVMTGGNQDTTSRLLVTLRILRKEHKSVLPVEIFSFPGEISDPHVLEELKTLDATVKELSGKTKLNIWKNFQIKADAIIKSSFQEVLYLDSDNIPVRDPAFLFEADLYAGKDKPGVVFWPDLNKDHPDNPIWRLVGKNCDHTEFEMESGQILINKAGNAGLNLAALHVAAHMQEDHEFYFSLSGGDKDTFRYAFWALGDLPYSVAPRWMSSLGYHSEGAAGRFCGIAMLQYDITPPSSTSPLAHHLPLFVHANLLKHRNIVPRGSAFRVIKRVSEDLVTMKSLDAARMWVYSDGGMCVDVEVETPQDDATKGEVGQRVVEENWEEAYEGKFRKFGDMYHEHGGKAGGW